MAVTAAAAAVDAFNVASAVVIVSAAAAAAAPQGLVFARIPIGQPQLARTNTFNKSS